MFAAAETATAGGVIMEHVMSTSNIGARRVLAFERGASNASAGPSPERVLAVQASLAEVVKAVRLIGTTDVEMVDQAFAAFGDLGTADTAPTPHELITLAVALARDGNNETVSYADVIEFTETRLGRPMPLAMVYKSFDSLCDQGFLREAAEEVSLTATGRRRRAYRITSDGRIALSLALATAVHRKESRDRAAA
jgi:hypothetical protein